MRESTNFRYNTGDRKKLTVAQCLEEFDQDVWTWRDGVITSRLRLGIDYAHRRSICTGGICSLKLADKTTIKIDHTNPNTLLPVPHSRDLGMPHLLL